MKWMNKVSVASLAVGCLAAAVLSGGCATTRPKRVVERADWALDHTPLNRNAAQLSNDSAEHLAWAKAWRSRILEVKGPRTVENTLVPYNEMMMHIDATLSENSVLANVHPDKDVRTVAEESEQKAQKFVTALELDRDLYEAFSAVDVSHADEETQYMLFKLLRDFRRAGVDKDEATRTRIAELNDEIVKIGQDFQRSLRDGQRKIEVDGSTDLTGLPADWIAKHPADANGKVVVTTDYPDYIPFMTYAQNADARRRLDYEFLNRGYPKNIDVLNRLIEKRAELATILGYSSWADYAIADKMMGSADHASKFINRIVGIEKDPTARDLEGLLARKRQDDPNATAIGNWEHTYYETKVRNEKYSFDPQEARAYFNFPDVLHGVLEVTSRMFGVTYKQVHGLNLWHPSVTAWNVYDHGKLIGRFYLDLHPRPNKYGHAAQFDYRTGIEGVRLPQGVLVCNFPNPADSPDGVALMEHHQVVTFFHEFGHLLHAIFAGHNHWIGTSGISTEWDFVEAPSQMLEEWCYNVDALRLFAKNYKTGKPIPLELVHKLDAARNFGKGVWTARQMFFTALSLNYYNRDPKNLDTTALMRELAGKYSPYEYPADTHLQCGFTHLDGYSAYYYTYIWSLVIAKDLLSRFQNEGFLNEKTALAYRKAVLEPGGSKPAAELIADFLGRPFSFRAFTAWLDKR